ncbi:MAG: hypothetical protein ACXQT4_03285 [Methanotrichaceae archaeon]
MAAINVQSFEEILTEGDIELEIDDSTGDILAILGDYLVLLINMAKATRYPVEGQLQMSN